MHMQKMATNDGRNEFNIPAGAPRSTTSGNLESNNKDDCVEIPLDVDDNLVLVVSEKTVVRNASSRIRQVSEEIKRLTTFSKRPVGRLERKKTIAAKAMKGLKFISKNDGGAGWEAIEWRFNDLTKDTNGLLPRSRFGVCIGMDKLELKESTAENNGLLPRLFGVCLGTNKESKDNKNSKENKESEKNEEPKDFAGVLFDALARRQNIKGDWINKELLKDFWYQISDQSFDSRLQIFLDMVDKDADGRITKDEVREIISLSASANKLKNIQTQADEYAALIMEELDPDKFGYILIENLEMLLLKAPTHNVSGESQKLSQMLSQKLKTTRHGNPLRRWYEDSKFFLQHNWKRCWLIVLWIGVMVGLFTWKYIQYKNRAVYEVLGPCVCIAKGAAEILKLNMAIILLPVCRNTITWLRNNTRLGVAVPFDDNINFHKLIAVAITIGVGLHAISHLTCDFPRLIHATKEEYEPMQQFFGDQPNNYWHFIKETEGYTGIIMVVLMTIAFTLATPWLRRSKLHLPSFLKKVTGFNAFWYTHHLFIIVYTLLIVHGIKLYLTKEWYKKTTWMYLAVPVLLYACERLLRVFRSSVKKVKIMKVGYPGDVLALHMSKPDGFKYKSGQYMFVNCAAVSPFEWHPFSITSAPGNDYLSVHIRTAGDWTGKIQTIFSEVSKRPSNEKSGIPRADCQEENRKFPGILIDGPYGAPAQDYKKYDIVLLVGLGIGATPMISIVKDIVNNMKAKEEEECVLENGGALQKKSVTNNFRTTRAYFYWVTREQDSYGWFEGVMNEAAEMDKNGVIEMHNYCTSVYEDGDARSALITMLQSLNHAKNGVDVVSGTRVKSHFAKPNWHNVYKSIALNHPGSRIGVFYCGLPILTEELRQLAHEFSDKTETKFEFHKENF